MWPLTQNNRPCRRKRKAALVRSPTRTTKSIRRKRLMEHSQLLDLVRRPLSPDTVIEVPASREEFEYVEDMLEQEEERYPLVQYDSVKGIAIVLASPTPLHSGIINELLHNICGSVRSQQGIDEDMKYRVYQETETDESTSGDDVTVRILNGAIRYKMNALDRLLMIAVEVGVSQSYSSLKDAISYAICVLHCPLGITVCISEGSRGGRPPLQYYQTRQEMNAAIQQAENDFRTQLQHHPYGPLVSDGVLSFGQVNRVVLDVFRREIENYPEGTRLDPTRSFTIVRNGEFAGEGVPANLVEVTLGDCIPTHLLIGQELQATPVNFFQQDWFEDCFRASILRTAIVRFRHKRAVQRPRS
ncbi:hypothetical protein V1520DRAFT_351047 [Lipomyces starkeyi]